MNFYFNGNTQLATTQIKGVKMLSSCILTETLTCITIDHGQERMPLKSNKEKAAE
jgi:hypothetical protein